ncbi:MAG TPA: hypothetical protein VGM56_10680, partial [Byssovorax sp.]
MLVFASSSVVLAGCGSSDSDGLGTGSVRDGGGGDDDGPAQGDDGGAPGDDASDGSPDSGPPLPARCTVTTAGTSGVILHGTVLAPD